MRVLTKEQIALNLIGLAMLMALAAWWYWQSTGVAAVPALIEQLHDPDPSTRIIAADWLGHIGPEATAAVHHCWSWPLRMPSNMPTQQPPQH